MGRRAGEAGRLDQIRQQQLAVPRKGAGELARPYYEGYSGRAYGFVSLQVRAVFLKIILPPE